jgi:hypothetical protein
MLEIEVIEMVKKTRLGLYLEDEEMKRQVKIAAARRGLSATTYCAQAIEERLRKDGEIGKGNDKKALLSRIDRFREEIGPVGITAAGLVKEGRRGE